MFINFLLANSPIYEPQLMVKFSEVTISFKVNHPFFHSFSQMWPPVTIRRPKSMGRSASPNTWNASWRTSATANPKRIKVASKPWRRSSTRSCPGWTRREEKLLETHLIWDDLSMSTVRNMEDWLAHKRPMKKRKGGDAGKKLHSMHCI